MEVFDIPGNPGTGGRARLNPKHAKPPAGANVDKGLLSAGELPSNSTANGREVR